MHILLIDDNRSFAESLIRSLPGHICQVAENLAEAKEKIRDSHYDAIFLDIILPDSDANSLTEFVAKVRIRQHECALLLITGVFENDQRIELLRDAVDAVCLKSKMTPAYIQASLKDARQHAKDESRGNALLKIQEAFSRLLHDRLTTRLIQLCPAA